MAPNGGEAADCDRGDGRRHIAGLPVPFGGDRQFSGDDHCFRGGGGGVCGDDYSDGSDQRRRDFNTFTATILFKI